MMKTHDESITPDKKVLICGGSGFIGSHLISYLQKKCCHVVLLSHRQHNLNGLKEYVVDTNSQQEIENAISLIAPDVVIFLSACYDHDDVKKVIDVNLSFPVMLMQALCRLPVMKRNMIFAGSYWSLGDDGNHFSALDNYAAAKKAVRTFAETYSFYSGIYFSNLVIYGSYGRHDHRGKLLDSIINAVKKNQTLALSPGEQYLDLVHIDDICHGFYQLVSRCLSRQEVGLVEDFSLATRQPVRVTDIITYIAKQYDVAMIHLGKRPYRAREIFSPQYLFPVVPEWTPRQNIYDYIDNEMNAR